MRLQHGKHNEDLCLIIKELKIYNDWVVTTAFYSCIHYVEHKIFPLTINGITFKKFNDYYRSLSPNKSMDSPRISKHEAKIELVEVYIKSVSSKYRWLYDTCMTTRYKNYIISNMIADISVQTLGIIKKACTEESALNDPLQGL